MKNNSKLTTYETILIKAVNIASLEGLECLSIGRLAKELNMSKSGVFAHFGSKQELNLAVIEKAKDIFIKEVILSVEKEPAGLIKLGKLFDSWLSYAERGVFPGGCFFAGVAYEYDGKKGPVHDKIVKIFESWLLRLEKQASTALSLNQINKNINPEDLVFELFALAMGANWARQLLKRKDAFKKARQLINQKLKNISI